MATALLAGCGGQYTRLVEEDKEASVEELAPESPVESLPSYEPGADTDAEIWQTEEALEDLGPQGLQKLIDVLSKEVSARRFADMQEALASRGYTCNGLVQ